MELNSITRFMIIFRCAGGREQEISTTVMLLNQEFDNMFEYLVRLNNREYSLISSIVDCSTRSLHNYSQTILSFENSFAHALPDYERIMIIDRDESYLSGIENLHKEYSKTLHVSAVKKKNTLLLCDLGDVIWDECSAQKHMAEIAIHFLNQNGYAVNMNAWIDAYKQTAMAYKGERFFHCIETVADRKAAEAIRRLVNEDFIKMSDARYFSLHPLRDHYIDAFYEIQKKCDICFVSNQPNKAYSLLKRYKIGVISPLWLLSCECGIKKPDVRLYEKCLQMIENAQYDNKYVCGNRKDMDLIPASKFGYKGILFLCKNSVINEAELFEDHRPFACVRDFIELKNAIIGR